MSVLLPKELEAMSTAKLRRLEREARRQVVACASDVAYQRNADRLQRLDHAVYSLENVGAELARRGITVRV